MLKILINLSPCQLSIHNTRLVSGNQPKITKEIYKFFLFFFSFFIFWFHRENNSTITINFNLFSPSKRFFFSIFTIEFRLKFSHTFFLSRDFVGRSNKKKNIKQKRKLNEKHFFAFF